MITKKCMLGAEWPGQRKAKTAVDFLSGHRRKGGQAAIGTVEKFLQRRTVWLVVSVVLSESSSVVDGESMDAQPGTHQNFIRTGSSQVVFGT